MSEKEPKEAPIPEEVAEETSPDSGRYHIAFRYFGGKFSHLGWLLPQLEVPCTYFVEPFGGSGAVILNRTPAVADVYNDLDGAIVNFMRTLRDQPEELVEQLQFTLYSREELARARQYLATDHPENPLEWARCWYVVVRQSRMSKPQGGGTNWSTGVFSTVSPKSRVKYWLGTVERLPEIVERLRAIEIDHEQALKVIARWAYPETLFYIDPPYTQDETAYRDGDRKDYRLGGFGPAEHVVLAALLHEIPSLVAISGYPGLMDTLYADWRRESRSDTVNNGGVAAALQRTEVLWMNYDLAGKRLGA